jgi:hypothetical protein
VTSVADYESIFQAAGKEWNVDPTLLKAIGHQESGGRSLAPNQQDAAGIMQLQGPTARDMGVTDRMDPKQSIYGGAKYYSQLLDKYKSPERALAAYNAGPGRFDDVLAGKVPMPEETAAYVPSVVGLHKRMSAGNTNTAAVPAADSLDAFLTGKGGNTAPKPDIAGSVVAPDAVDTFLMGKAGPASKPDTAPSPAEIPSPPGVAGVDDLGRPYPGAQSSPAQPAQTATPRILDAPPSAPTAPPGVAGVDDLGRPVPNASTTNQTPQPNAISRILGSAAQGAQEGFGDGPLGLNDAAKNALYPQGYAGGPAQAFNKLVIGGGAALGDLAMRAGGALYRGAQGAVAQTGAEVGQPQLGRDLASMPDAFMGSPGSIPGRVSAPASVVTDQVPAIADRVANQLQFARENDVQGPNRGAFLLNKLTDAIKGADAAPEPVPVTQGALMRITPPDGMPVGAVDGAPRPNSVGASATPDELARMTPNETRSARADAENAKLNEPQPVGPDYNKYVDGANVPMAHLEQSADISREQKNLESNFPNEYKDQKRIDNLAVQDHINSVIPSKTQINTMDMARSAQAEADTAGLWKTAKDADVGPLVGQVSDLLKSPKGKNDSVASAANKILAKLTNEDGSPITDAETLYEIRKGVANSYGKDVVSLDPIKKDGARVLHDTLLPALDHVIETAAPGYRTYMDNYASSSRAIETAQTLAEHQNRFTDTAGNVQLGRLKTVLKDIVEARGQPFETPEGRIPDETMQALWDARYHLRRASASDDLARAASSDSIPNLFDHMKGLAKAGVVGAAHLAIGSQWPLVGNWALNKAQSIYGAREGIKAQQVQKTRAREMLYPDRTNRLAPPRVD